jgi:hypothetical protein
MCKFRAILIAILCSSGSLANADSFSTTEKIAKVIAAEEFCSLKHNHNAIQAWIENNVPADDMAFPENLNFALSLAKDDQSSPSETAKTAYCRQISQIAKHYSFSN